MGDVLASRLRRQTLQAEFAAATEQALAGSRAPADPRSAPADIERLRGIPVVGGAPGVMRGTDPLRATLSRSRGW